MAITGAVLVGADERRRQGGFRGFDPAIGEAIGPDISEASLDDVADACRLAAAAAEAFGQLEPNRRASFIEAVAQAILDIGDELVATATAETGLPQARLQGERMRTVNQLRLFAQEVRDGHWLDVTIDRALPERAPPRPDLRRMNVALGPVAVFGASNFPLAFSVAGGDTAAAFAAGCPVVVKGHPAHPATGELVARAVRSAVAAGGLPPGIFSYLPGRSNALGAALVSDPRIKAVGFTGSRSGGLALVELAARRAEPIPVYAEMSSINPVVLMPAALAARADAIAAAFVASLTLGAGQFCTNPGLVIAIEGPDLDRFAAAAAAAVAQVQPAPMLTAGIHAAYQTGVAALEGRARQVGAGPNTPLPNHCAGAIFEIGAAEFMADRTLADEVFGASSLIVRCQDIEEMRKVIAELEGQLTASLQLDPADEEAAAPLLSLLRERAGRVLANGWPTGVEVSHAMVHGGPFPATSDGRSTSVGTLAMSRFLRPVCYQDIPERLLPHPLRDGNPWRLPRRVDGVWETV